MEKLLRGTQAITHVGGLLAPDRQAFSERSSEPHPIPQTELSFTFLTQECTAQELKEARNYQKFCGSVFKRAEVEPSQVRRDTLNREDISKCLLIVKHHPPGAQEPVIVAACSLVAKEGVCGVKYTLTNSKYRRMGLATTAFQAAFQKISNDHEKRFGTPVRMIILESTEMGARAAGSRSGKSFWEKQEIAPGHNLRRIFKEVGDLLRPVRYCYPTEEVGKRGLPKFIAGSTLKGIVLDRLRLKVPVVVERLFLAHKDFKDEVPVSEVTHALLMLKELFYNKPESHFSKVSRLAQRRYRKVVDKIFDLNIRELGTGGVGLLNAEEYRASKRAVNTPALG